MAEVIGDWEADLLDPLVANMRALAAVIAKHGIIEDVDKIVAEVQEALTLLDTWRNFDNFDGDFDDFVRREDAAWWDFWNYLGEHIRGWWD